MENNKKRRVSLYHHKTHSAEKSENEVELLVEYSSKNEVSYEECFKIRLELSNYLTTTYNSITDDILDVVRTIKEITKPLDESRLMVSIRKYNYGESVLYDDGHFESAKIHKKNWDDILVVSDDFKGTNIQYNKSHMHIRNEQDANLILTEIDVFNSKLIELRRMSQDNIKNSSIIKVKEK